MYLSLTSERDFATTYQLTFLARRKTCEPPESTRSRKKLARNTYLFWWEHRVLHKKNERQQFFEAILLERHGSINGHLRWFEAYLTNKQFYQRITKSPLSIRTTGSIDVEHKVKPIKGKILTKSHRKIKDDKTQMLFQASENLGMLNNMKMDLKHKGMPSTLVCSDFLSSLQSMSKKAVQDIESINNHSNSDKEFLDELVSYAAYLDIFFH